MSRTKRALHLIETEPHLSLREIAERCGISKGYVGALRQALERRREFEAKAAEDLYTLSLDDAGWRYVQVRGGSVRLVNCLQSEGMSVRDLLSLTDAELLRIPNFGGKSLRELREIIGKSTADTYIPAHVFQHWAAI